MGGCGVAVQSLGLSIMMARSAAAVTVTYLSLSPAVTRDTIFDRTPHPHPSTHPRLSTYHNSHTPQRRNSHNNPTIFSMSSHDPYDHDHHHHSSHSQQHHASDPSTSLQPYTYSPSNPNNQLQPHHPSQPPYSRHSSHQSHHSHHSHHSDHSHHSHRSEREIERERREVERRPTLGDTVLMVWRTLVGVFTGRRD